MALSQTINERVWELVFQPGCLLSPFSIGCCTFILSLGGFYCGMIVVPWSHCIETADPNRAKFKPGIISRDDSQL